MKKSLIFLAVLTVCTCLYAAFPSPTDRATYGNMMTRYQTAVGAYNTIEGQYNNANEMYAQLLSILPANWPPDQYASSWNGNKATFNSEIDDVGYDLSKMSQYLNNANNALVDANAQLNGGGNESAFDNDISGSQNSLSLVNSWNTQAGYDLGYANTALTNLLNIYYTWYWTNYPG